MPITSVDYLADSTEATLDKSGPPLSSSKAAFRVNLEGAHWAWGSVRMQSWCADAIAGLKRQLCALRVSYSIDQSDNQTEAIIL
jgi:hypothetical protein